MIRFVVEIESIPDVSDEVEDDISNALRHAASLAGAALDRRASEAHRVAPLRSDTHGDGSTTHSVEIAPHEHAPPSPRPSPRSPVRPVRATGTPGSGTLARGGPDMADEVGTLAEQAFGDALGRRR